MSGSGKSTLVRELLFPALCARLKDCDNAAEAEESGADIEKCSPEGHCRIRGAEALGGAVMVDQSAIGRTPRSNPAVYIGAFDSLRDLFAESDLANQRGMSSSAFSFNSSQGQCEKCHGAGFEKIEMQFLSDVFIRCSECNGRRYRPHILEVTIASSVSVMLSSIDSLTISVEVMSQVTCLSGSTTFM